MDVKVAISQTRCVTGDLEGNSQRVVRDIRRAIVDQVDIIVFPEVVISGYCCGALFNQQHFIEYNIRFLKEVIAPEVTGYLVAIVGFVDLYGTRNDGFPNIRNSVAIIQNGEIQFKYDKILLANGNHHEDRKYFSPGQESKVFEIETRQGKLKIGTPICEDVWNIDHSRNIIGEMVDARAELILCANQSYFYYGKQEIRQALFGNQAKQQNIPVINVNAVGVGDIVKNIIVFDGGSMVFNRYGDLVRQLDRFKEDYQTVHIDLDWKDESREFGRSTETPKESMTRYRNEIVSILPHDTKIEEIYNALVFEQRELFKVLGIEKAQVHISGGIDSAVVACIVVEAMGKDNTVFISNPTNSNGSTTKNNAQYMADQLGVYLYWNSMEEPYQALKQNFEFEFGDEPNNMVKTTMQAVGRTVQGLAACHHFKSGIVATGNHTENVLGWASFHDIGSVGVHQPIGDLTKVEVFELAYFINQKHGKEIIPTDLITGKTKPAAELVDANEDPFDYWIQSGICAEIIRHKKDILDLLKDYDNKTLSLDYFPASPDGITIYQRANRQQFEQQARLAFDLSRKSVFKSAQAAPIVQLADRSRGFSDRETIINHYQGIYQFNQVKQPVEL